MPIIDAAKIEILGAPKGLLLPTLDPRDQRESQLRRNLQVHIGRSQLWILLSEWAELVSRSANLINAILVKVEVVKANLSARYASTVVDEGIERSWSSAVRRS